MRQLSSAWTPFHKFVFPTLWLGAVTTGSVAATFSMATHGGGGERWLPLIMPVLGGMLLYVMVMRLKKVVLDGDTLVISSYVREVRVPLKEVERVTGSILRNPEVIWLHFRWTTDFGDSIMFMPPLRFRLALFSVHPMVEELRELVSQASLVSPGRPAPGLRKIS